MNEGKDIEIINFTFFFFLKSVQPKWQDFGISHFLSFFGSKIENKLKNHLIITNLRIEMVISLYEKKIFVYGFS